jgi:hypothetical protein
VIICNISDYHSDCQGRLVLQNNLLLQVRAGFVLGGTTLATWCRANGIDPGYAHKALAGKTNGPKARQLRDRILSASQQEAA